MGLTEAEELHVRDTLNSERYQDMAPGEAHANLLDEVVCPRVDYCLSLSKIAFISSRVSRFFLSSSAIRTSRAARFVCKTLKA